MIQYVYTAGPYREFRGYCFANGKPVTITDRGTLEEIAKDPTFKRVAPVQEEPASDPYACPKCGRVVKQGHYMHVKHCQG